MIVDWVKLHTTRIGPWVMVHEEFSQLLLYSMQTFQLNPTKHDRSPTLKRYTWRRWTDFLTSRDETNVSSTPDLSIEQFWCKGIVNLFAISIHIRGHERGQTGQQTSRHTNGTTGIRCPRRSHTTGLSRDVNWSFLLFVLSSQPRSLPGWQVGNYTTHSDLTDFGFTPNVLTTGTIRISAGIVPPRKSLTIGATALESRYDGPTGYQPRRVTIMSKGQLIDYQARKCEILDKVNSAYVVNKNMI